MSLVSSLRLSGVLVVAGFSLVGFPATSDAQVRGYLYASVVDRDDQPVLDLTADDFVVSVGGIDRRSERRPKKCFLNEVLVFV